MSGPDYEPPLESPIEDDARPSLWNLVLGGIGLVAAAAVLWLLFGQTSPDDEGAEVDSVSATTSPPAVAQVPVSSASTSSPTTQPMNTTSSTAEQPSDIPERLDALLDELVPIGGFSGVVLVAKDDEVMWIRAEGLADVDSETAIHPDSRFNLGSMDKMFTAVGILQLMEKGLLSLDGTVAEYLPNYPNADIGAEITIEHLLTHTSGLVVDVFNEEFGQNPHQYRENKDYLPLFVNEPLQFAPGGQFGYSNAGFIILGLIIEELSGVSYDEYVYEHIFEPSGMFATGAEDVEDDFADLAIGFTTMDIAGNDSGVLIDHRPLMPGRGSAAGGGYSTAGDLHRFRNALLDHRLLSPESLDLLITGRVHVSDQAEYALGFFDRIQAGERVVGHGGGAPGVCSSLAIYPDSGYTVVVLSNSDRDCIAVLELLSTDPPR
jgi:CubicO group peptidase (beta-lactamase class C family)